ncbi:MAG: MXAN_2562 family outer membrane beta-barrel protein [Proteobacteria bacterium]|nr:MXAN_2562 family outer membrane beta-barrel protein [Pseudomonadota bacterium]
MQIRFSLFGALVAFLLGFGLPMPAVANTGQTNWTASSNLSSDFSLSGTRTGVGINLLNCRALLKPDDRQITFEFVLAKAQPSNGAKYSVKFASGGSQRCEGRNRLDHLDGDDCIILPGFGNVDLTSSTSPITASRTMEQLSPAAFAGSCKDITESAYVYLIVEDTPPLSSTKNVYTVTYEVRLETKRPASVTGVEAIGGGGSINVSWSAVTDARSYNVYYGAEGVVMTPDLAPEDLTGARRVNIRGTSAKLTDGVFPNMTFLISVSSVNEFGNESLLKEIVHADTVPSNDFWDTFREQNADVDGGFCFIATAAWGSTQDPHVSMLRRFRDEVLMPTAFGRAFVETYYSLSPPLAHFIGQYPAARAVARTMLWPAYGFAWLMLHAPVVLGILGAFLIFGVGFAVRRRLRIRHASVSAVRAAGIILALILVPTLAPNEALAEASPVNMMIEFKAGPYTPNKLGAAFDTHFSGKSGYIIELEYDWQFWRGVGSLGLGFHLAYGSISGKSVKQSDSSIKTIDSTSLHWLPLRLSLVYRFDYLWTRFGFPFTLYGKAGFDYAFWWVIDGSGSISTAADGTRGYGGTFGFHAVGGVAFVLNWLAPGMAKSFDVEWGVNNSYIFAEFMYAQIDNFGAKGAFNLTDQATFLIGLGLEF